MTCTGIKENIKEKTACEYSYDQKMWALATIGIITEMNGDSHSLLGGCEKTEKNINRVKEQLLRKWWGIKNREDLISTLDWLEKWGHRKRLYNEGKKLNKMAKGEYIKLLHKYKDNKQNRQQLYKAYWCYRSFGKKSIIAWDYCRYIALCGWGYMAGYLSEEEAWALLMPKAIELQDSFNSWGEMGDNYLHGRAYWSWEQTVGSNMPGQKAMRNLERKINDNPWKKYDWNYDLVCNDLFS